MGNGPTFPPLSLFLFRVFPWRRRREGPASAPPIPAVPTAEAAEELGIEVCAAERPAIGGPVDAIDVVPLFLYRCRWV